MNDNCLPSLSAMDITPPSSQPLIEIPLGLYKTCLGLCYQQFSEDYTVGLSDPVKVPLWFVGKFLSLIPDIEENQIIRSELYSCIDFSMGGDDDSESDV